MSVALKKKKKLKTCIKKKKKSCTNHNTIVSSLASDPARLLSRKAQVALGPGSVFDI